MQCQTLVSHAAHNAKQASEDLGIPPSTYTGATIVPALEKWQDEHLAGLNLLSDCESGMWPLKAGYNEPPLVPVIFLNVLPDLSFEIDEVLIYDMATVSKQSPDLYGLMQLEHKQKRNSAEYIGTHFVIMMCGTFGHLMPFYTPRGFKGKPRSHLRKALGCDWKALIEKMAST